MVAETDDLEDESLVIDAPVLRTERLVLRRPETGDVDALVTLADNRKVAEMLARMPNPYGEAEATAFIAMATKSSEAIYVLTTLGERPGVGGALVGCAGLNMTDRGLELGYWIGEPYWRKGYATEATRAVLDYGFNELGLEEITAVTHPDNAASQHVLTKCGLKRDGTLNYNGGGEIPFFRLPRSDYEKLLT